MHDIFIDESCHLEKDGISVMCIGYIKVPTDNYDVLRNDFLVIKDEYKTSSELKWNKFSYSRLPYYKALVDFFFASPLEFRCVLVKYKDRLRESPFKHFQHIRSHDNVFIQLADFFIGAITYKARIASGENLGNQGRLEFIAYLENVSGFTLSEGTVPWETKFNIFDHQPRKL